MIPNKRDDLWLQPGERKVSGTAARIAHGRAYHHMSLLVNVDLSVLKESLKSPFAVYFSFFFHLCCQISSIVFCKKLSILQQSSE